MSALNNRLFSSGMDQGERLAAVLPIEREVGVKRQYLVVLEKLGHPDDAGSGKGDRPIVILFPESLDFRQVLLQMKRYPESTLFDQAEERVLGRRQPGEKK